MKKRMALLLALVLLAMGISAYGETLPDLYDLYAVTGEGKTWAGTAVPLLEGVAIVSPAGLSGSPAAIEVWDGANSSQVYLSALAANGKLLVMLSDPEGREPGIPQYFIMDPDQPLQTGDLIVRSGDSLGSRINRAVYDAVPITWQDMECLLLTLSGDTPLGSPLQTRNGELAGMVAAEYAEGENRYIALTIDEILRSIDDVAASLNEEAAFIPEGYTVTVQDNMVTFDWSEAKLPEPPEGTKLYHVVTDPESAYLNYVEIEAGITFMRMLLTPGRTYYSGVSLCEGDELPDYLHQRYAVTTLPAAEPLTDYAFRSMTFAIGDLAEDVPDDVMPVPVEEITEEFLRGGRSCFLSVTSYDVDRRITDLPLLVTLTDPEGSNYRWESSWMYDPFYEKHDEWYVRMNESGLLDLLNATGYPEGEYRMDMYIGGKLADSFTFTLKK